MNKKSIALVWPKATFLENPKIWPPLGLLYLSSQLEAQGHHTEFFDLNFQELPKDGDFDQLWLSATSPQMKETRRVAEIVSHWTKTKSVLGGAGAWANPKTHLELPFNTIVSGESDHPDIIKIIVEETEKDKRDECWIKPPISKTLDWVLPPNRRWTTDYHSYMKDAQGNTYRMSSLFTARGCPMECAFCESGRHGIIWDRLTRYESLEIVETQIRQIKDLGFTGLAYYDDILPLNKRRTLEIMKLHQKYNMKFRCFLRTDIINKQGGKEYLQQLADGGLIEIFVGVESADNKIKDGIHKGTTIEQDTNVLQWCKEIGITCKMSFILGLPGESRESMEKTRAWILENRPHRTQVDRLIPFPGTPLGDRPEEFDIKYDRQVDDEFFYKGREDLDLKSFVSTSNLTREEIDLFWHDLEIEMKKEGLFG
jgi:anaerobic magnesium-protoporphyrin IX monomethyl ester cyclase